MTNKVRVLVVDDDAQMRRYVRAGFDSLEMAVREAKTGRQGIRTVASEHPNIVLLDLGLPDLDGLDVLMAIRKWSNVPVIVLSAREDVRDKVAALDAGADDYLTKPCRIEELLARIRVVLRRHGTMEESPSHRFEFGDLTIDLAARTVFREGRRVRLTGTESHLLTILLQQRGMVVTHNHLLSMVWGDRDGVNHHYLRVYMNQIRRKLEIDPAQPRYILSEYGVGYRFNA